MYLNKENISPVFIDGKYTHLDNKNGYSSLDNHHVVRSDFCKLYSKENLYSDYRLSDMVISETHRSKNSGRKLHYEKFPNSLATNYMKTTNKNNDYILLKELVEKYDSTIIPLSDDLIIHLRVGDVLEKSKYTVDEHLKDYKNFHNQSKTNYVYPLSYYKEKLELKEFKNIKNIILVCGGSFDISIKSKEYISKIESFIKSKGFKELMIGGASRRLLVLALFEIRIT